MRGVAPRVGYGPLLLGAVICPLAACRGDSLSAVERAAMSERDPTVILVGEIIVESPGQVPDNAQIVLNFVLPPDRTPIESYAMGWNGSGYRLNLYHGRACAWSLNVTLWDGRRSESWPVTDDPTAPCEGYMIGPDFWFP